MPKAKAKKTTSRIQKGPVSARAYTSPTLVLLAMDWPDGADFPDFLGFAILRSPGFHPGEKDGYLLNKIGFAAPDKNSQSLPSNLSPIQKFLWWDSAINPEDGGKTFNYTVTPVRGTGPSDLTLEHEAETTVVVAVPNVERDNISTWFNRAVVSSQAFSREFQRPLPEKDIDNAMKWLANGLENAFAAILGGAKNIEGAIYHLTDNEWVLPSFEAFKGELSIVYEDRKNDQTDRPAVERLGSLPRFTGSPRSKTNIMHDKFLVDTTAGRVLMGSANFTPEGLTSQANLLHIFDSPELATLYSKRQQLLQGDPSVPDTANGAEWSEPMTIGKSKVRVFFSPEPRNARVSIDTVVKAIEDAEKSVIFCMFEPTDPNLLDALMATSDNGKLLYGLLNSISDPSKKADNLSDSGEAPRKPSQATEIQVKLFNRSRKDKKILAYSY
ncbi:MAG TPA: hypothetical protein VFO40_04460, partial [Chthoniobacterales bacterium]|nr:hypothetical protein [Chthoniobacterales bacterium]